MKADPQLLVSDSPRGACTTKEELALWKPGRKLSGSRHVGTAQGLAQERRILCVLLLSSVRLPGSNLNPHGRMQQEWEWKESGCREMLFLCNLWRLLGRSQVSVSGYGIPSNLCCGHASSAAHFSIVFSLKSDFSLAARPLIFSINILYYLFVKVNITIIVDALGACFFTWKVFSCRTASVPDMFIFVTWFSPRPVHGAGITNMKWDLRLKNLDNMVAIGHSDILLFFPEKSLWWKKESGKLNLVLSTDLDFCWTALNKKKVSLKLRFSWVLLEIIDLRFLFSPTSVSWEDFADSRDLKEFFEALSQHKFQHFIEQLLSWNCNVSFLGKCHNNSRLLLG